MSSSGATTQSSATDLEIDREEPKSFNIVSGELLWGQYHCLLEGSRSSARDGPTFLASRRQDDGTILTNDWQYRLAARKGEWKVSRLFIDENKVGFIAYHADIDPIEYAKLASDIGISSRSNQEHKKMLFINRYDWSGSHGDSEDFVQTASALTKEAPSNKEDEEGSNYHLIGGCCVLLDAAYFDSLLHFYGRFAPKSEFPPKKSFSFVSSNRPVGVHLTDDHIEYELAWIGFSGDPQPAFSGSDECVAFVFDTAYTGLEVVKGQTLRVGDRLAKTI